MLFIIPQSLVCYLLKISISVSKKNFVQAPKINMANFKRNIMSQESISECGT